MAYGNNTAVNRFKQGMKSYSRNQYPMTKFQRQRQTIRYPRNLMKQQGSRKFKLSKARLKKNNDKKIEK